MMNEQGGDFPLTPDVMTVFAWLMTARENGRRAFVSDIVRETRLDESVIVEVTAMLSDSGWLKRQPDGYEITPDGGLAFYALVSGTLPPAPGEV